MNSYGHFSIYKTQKDLIRPKDQSSLIWICWGKKAEVLKSSVMH